MRGLTEPRRAAALALLLALLLRAWDFGNPIIHVDEQWYLLVGDRMLHGAVPYIDLWDRKPIGLFLIYAGARLLGDGVLPYQLLATLCAAATAWLVIRGALLAGGRERGALAAGAAYLVWVSLLGGRGGQSPVFYNLPMAAGGVLTLGLPALAEAGRVRAIIARGALVCLLAGLAIQIKYVAAPEAAFFGIAHLRYLRRAGARAGTMTMAALLLAALGVAPTLAAIAVYAAMGAKALTAFWFANFTSIFLRASYDMGQLGMRLLGIVAQLAPLIACAALGLQRGRPAPLALAQAWVVAAVIGFAAIGTFFDHYALPLVAPLTIAAAPALGRDVRAMIGTLGLGLMIFSIERIVRSHDTAGARAVARIVAANDRGGCPYVFTGDTATYTLAHACVPTAYAFPNLLAYATEEDATGIDEAAEVRRILAGRPPVIVASTRQLSIWNRGSLAAVKTALARDYRPVFSTPRDNYRTVVFLRNDLPYRAG